jgi:hypothetical protein
LEPFNRFAYAKQWGVIYDDAMAMTSLARKQLLGMSALGLTTFSLINHYFEIGVFGEHSGQLVTLSLVVLGIAAFVCAPNTEEDREIRRRWEKFWAR